MPISAYSQVRDTNAGIVPGNIRSSQADVQQTINSIRQLMADLALFGAGLDGGFAAPIPLVGVTDASNAPSGIVGEVITNSLAAPGAALTTATAANVIAIGLTAGDWDVYGDVSWQTAAATSVTRLVCSVSLTSGVLDQAGQGTAFGNTFPAFVAGAGPNFFKYGVGPTRVNIAASQFCYLVAFANFTAGTLSAYGSIYARRAR